MGCTSSAPEPDYYYRNEGWIVAGTQVVPTHSYPAEFFGYDPKVKMDLPCIDNTKLAQCDLFYVHSTSIGIDDKNREEIDMHCSIFNNCCQVYCPKYHAAIDITSAKQLNVAYVDIKEAFNAFLANYNHTKPFILAGHGQGSYLLYRLIREEFMNQTPRSEDLCARCVVAYLPGITLFRSEFPSNDKLLEFSTNPVDTRTIISWKTCYNNPNESVYDINVAELNSRNKQIRSKSKSGADEKSDDIDEQRAIASNPLSFDQEKMKINKEANLGSMSQTGVLQPSITGCHIVKDNYFQLTDDISSFNSMKSDYLPFYMNIRFNAAVRIDHWIRQQVL